MSVEEVIVVVRGANGAQLGTWITSPYMARQQVIARPDMPEKIINKYFGIEERLGDNIVFPVAGEEEEGVTPAELLGFLLEAYLLEEVEELAPGFVTIHHVLTISLPEARVFDKDAYLAAYERMCTRRQQECKARLAQAMKDYGISLQ